jgi:hypothetical protein
MKELYRVVKASERNPPENIINTYHTIIRMIDMGEVGFPSGTTYSSEWEVSEDYEVIEWLEPLESVVGVITPEEIAERYQFDLGLQKSMELEEDIKEMVDQWFKPLPFVDKDKLAEFNKLLNETVEVSRKNELLEDALAELVSTAESIWNDYKPIKDSNGIVKPHPVIEAAKQLLNK